MRIFGVLVVVWSLIGIAQGVAAEDEPAPGDLFSGPHFSIGRLQALGIADKAGVRDRPAVEGLGDPRRWEVQGATAFSADEIIKALASNIDVACASRSIPPQEVDGFLNKLSSKIRAGYQSHGFPYVEIQFVSEELRLEQQLQSSKFIISIDEGQRFLAGDVRVTGTKTIDAAWLAQELAAATEPLLPPDQAQGPRPKTKRQGVCWPTGKPAWFDSESLDKLRQRVETLLSERGKVLANFTLETTPDADQGLAHLVIHFHHEGLPATIGEIEVTGNKRSSREQLLTFLDLQTGMLLTHEVTDRVRDRLTNSGRFVKSNFKTVLPTKPGEPLKLRISVTEYDQPPPLDQPLSREEEALVRFSRWARQFEDGDDDLLLEISSAAGVQELIISPGHGILALVRAVPDGEDASEVAAPFQFAYLATDHEIGMFSLKRRTKIVSVPPPTPLFANLNVEIHSRRLPYKGQGTFMAGLGMSSRTKQGKERHFRVRINQDAAAALAISHLENSNGTWEGNVLRVDYRDRCLRIDEATGPMVELLLPPRPEADAGQWRFTVSQGEFERRANAIRVAAADFTNEADATRPMSCVCTFLCNEALAWQVLAGNPDFRHGAAIGSKVTNLGLFEPLDKLLVAACRPAPEHDEFSIPVANLAGDNSADELSRLLRTLARCWGVSVGDGLLPRDTWAWQLWREATFHYAQLGKTEEKQETAVQPAGWGAMACLAMSQLLPDVDDTISASLASEGLKRLSLDDFRRDYSAILDRESFLGRYVWRIAEVIRGLDEEDVQWLQQLDLVESDVCTPEAKEMLFEVARLLRESNRPVEEALPSTLDTWWRLGLRGAVATTLETMAWPASGSYPTTYGDQVGYNPFATEEVPSNSWRAGATPGAPAASSWKPGTKASSKVTPKQALRPTGPAEAGDARVTILGPVTSGGPPVALDPPTPDEVLRALKRARRVDGSSPLSHESEQNNVQMVIEPIADYVDPPRVYPLIGSAQLHHAHYKCMVYFTEVTRNGSTVTKDEREVVLHVDHNHIHIVGNVNDGPGRVTNGEPAIAPRAKAAPKQAKRSTRPAGNSEPADQPR